MIDEERVGNILPYKAVITSKHRPGYSPLLKMDSRSSTVDMYSGVIHSTVFSSLLFVQAYPFYLLLSVSAHALVTVATCLHFARCQDLSLPHARENGRVLTRLSAF